jgi:hypothetical protein
MLKAIRPLILCLIVIGACQKSDIQFEPPNVQKQVLSKKEINDITLKLLSDHNQFKWSMVSDQLLWSAGMQSDSIFALGYQPEGFKNIEENIHLIDIDSEQWLTAKNHLNKIILEGEEKMEPGSKIEITDLLPFGEPEILPSFAVRITNINTITQLRAQGELRYLEAMGYYPNNTIDQRSDSGCGVSPNYNIPGSEYTSVLPSAKVPWNFYHHNIPTAWNQSTGDGVRVVIIDTGTSSGQNNLGSQFNSGYSQNRNVTKISTLYTGMWWWKRLTSPHDECGHGTQMAGMATGPRSNDGNSVGVAYNADLLGIHATQDVIISSSNEKNGVKNALIVAGNNSSVRVISMSIGTIFWSGTVADGIY